MSKGTLLSMAFILLGMVQLKAGERFISAQAADRAVKALADKFGAAENARIRKGVNQAAAFWVKEDGSEADFEKLCTEYFIGSPEKLEENFRKLSTHFEVLGGHFNKISLDLKRPLHLDEGEILQIDMLFGGFDPSAHLTEDFFKNKIAFLVLLNFPHYSLAEKAALGPQWSRKEWAYARMGDVFTSRASADVLQKISDAFTAAGTYIDEYNIAMGHLVDAKGQTYFPRDLKLISHWGLRDELKGRYADPKGFERQKMIYEVMKRIVAQEIPASVINKADVEWDPSANVVYKEGKKIEAEREPDTRYKQFLNVFRAVRELDPYYPSLPSHVARKFEAEREIPESEVEKMFAVFVSSSQVRGVGKLISGRLGRPLQPFDIWYDGFKPRSSISEDTLNKIVAARYPDIKAFQQDIPNILMKLGFSPEKAEFIAARIEVDPARGAGHAWGAEMKSEKAHLRTRVPKGGIDYKGFNIAMHELGHCVEQTLTLQNVDYYMMRGVPNTAFTEAFAFVFQAKDLDVLGIKNEDPVKKHLAALDNVWASYEIMGVSLVDMKAWNWLYKNPAATPEQLKQAVIAAAKDVWNRYYADIFGVKDQPILAIYSHMIDAALYLPDYPIGHVIGFQVERFLEGKSLGVEMERMCVAGRLIPQLWMKNAVGSEISPRALLDAGKDALEVIH